MPSTAASRKLWHVLRYLLVERLAKLPWASMRDGQLDWGLFKRTHADLLDAALIVSRLRDEELGWRG